MPVISSLSSWLSSSLVLAAVAAGGDAPAPAACAVGTHTTLAVEILERPRVPRHDESIGNDRLVLRGADGKKVFSEDTHDAHWLCLGFDRGKGRYLVGGYQEQGTWLVLGPILYLAEDAKGGGKRLEESAFSRQELMAMSSLTSPSGRYVAFVGGVGVIDGLYVLDTEADTIRRVGKAPAPPPLGDDFTCDETFRWGSCWVGAYAPLEPEVLRFDGDDTLVVTYGHDTHRRRAPKRTTQRIKL
jgi:hypothetical protein